MATQRALGACLLLSVLCTIKRKTRHHLHKNVHHHACGTTNNRKLDLRWLKNRQSTWPEGTFWNFRRIVIHKNLANGILNARYLTNYIYYRPHIGEISLVASVRPPVQVSLSNSSGRISPTAYIPKRKHKQSMCLSLISSATSVPHVSGRSRFLIQLVAGQKEKNDKSSDVSENYGEDRGRVKQQNPW